MLYKYLLLALLLLAATAGDIRSYRINNATVAAGVAAGLVLSFVTGGLSSLAVSIMAAIIPAVLLIVLFALRMLGAGDIKLFCAVGAIAGVAFILPAMAFSFLAGGIAALFIMLVRGNIKQRLRHIAAYLKASFLTGKLGPYTDFSDKSDGAKFHFSLAIAAGCIMQSVITLFY
jgi:prepilin peptidase CpaA